VYKLKNQAFSKRELFRWRGEFWVFRKGNPGGPAWRAYYSAYRIKLHDCGNYVTLRQ